MGILGKLFGGANDVSNRIQGRTDLLEAVCASAALIAAADGDIADNEVEAAINVVTNNEGLAKAFDARTIETTMDKMIKRAKGGFSGRQGLWKDIDDISKDFNDSEAVYLIALDVAYSDDDVGAKEKEALSKLAQRLKVDPSKYV
jgi:tellurite resistance protein TerB